MHLPALSQSPYLVGSGPEGPPSSFVLEFSIAFFNEFTVFDLLLSLVSLSDAFIMFVYFARNGY